MRSARLLYRFQIALATVGGGLVVAAAAVVASDQRFALPSGAEISRACDSWFSTGGPPALLGLAVAALAGTALFLGLRSGYRQVRANRRYLDKLPISGEEVVAGGARARLIETAEPHALCAGYLRPSIYISRGIMERLGNEELRAVVGHEAHHRRRRDPLRVLVARALADALFFMPILGRISDRYKELGELAADDAAVKAVRGRGPLASALLKFCEQDALPSHVVGIDPERVDHLIGSQRAGRWSLSRSSLGRSVLAIAGLGALVLLIWHGVLNPTLEIPFLLAAGCATLMIGGPIALAAAALVRTRRGWRARSAGRVAGAV